MGRVLSQGAIVICRVACLSLWGNLIASRQCRFPGIIVATACKVILRLYSSVDVRFPSFFQQRACNLSHAITCACPPLRLGVGACVSRCPRSLPNIPKLQPRNPVARRPTHPATRPFAPKYTPPRRPISEPYVKHLVSGLLESGFLPSLAKQRTQQGEEEIWRTSHSERLASRRRRSHVRSVTSCMHVHVG